MWTFDLASFAMTKAISLFRLCNLVSQRPKGGVTETRPCRSAGVSMEPATQPTSGLATAISVLFITRKDDASLLVGRKMEKWSPSTISLDGKTHPAIMGGTILSVVPPQARMGMWHSVSLDPWALTIARSTVSCASVTTRLKGRSCRSWGCRQKKARFRTDRKNSEPELGHEYITICLIRA